MTNRTFSPPVLIMGEERGGKGRVEERRDEVRRGEERRGGVRRGEEG